MDVSCVDFQHFGFCGVSAVGNHLFQAEIWEESHREVDFERDRVVKQ